MVFYPSIIIYSDNLNIKFANIFLSISFNMCVWGSHEYPQHMLMVEK